MHLKKKNKIADQNKRGKLALPLSFHLRSSLGGNFSHWYQYQYHIILQYLIVSYRFQIVKCQNEEEKLKFIQSAIQRDVGCFIIVLRHLVIKILFY